MYCIRPWAPSPRAFALNEVLVTPLSSRCRAFAPAHFQIA